MAEAIRVAAVLLRPVMPGSCAEILRRVGDRTPAGELRLDRDGRWRSEGVREIAKGAALWPRAEEVGGAGAAKRTRRGEEGPGPAERTRRDEEKPVDDTPIGGGGEPVTPGATQAAGAGATPAEDARISIDEFMKVELRVAKVLEAEAVPKSKKLVKLTVDTGVDQRTIVAGIAEAYQPEQLVGRTIVIVANLKPAKLMGIESNGMVLAGSVDGGKPILVSFDEPLPPGARVR